MERDLLELAAAGGGIGAHWQPADAMQEMFVQVRHSYAAGPVAVGSLQKASSSKWRHTLQNWLPHK
jgi:hypothetical protein